MKKFIKILTNNRYLLFSFLTCVFTLIALVHVVVATFAWTSENRIVEQDNLSFGLLGSNVSGVELYVRPVDSISNDNLTYVFLPDKIATELPKYDPNGIVSSQYAKALVLEFDFNIYANTNIVITVNAGMPYTNVEHNYLSNCVSVSRVSTKNGNTLTTTAELTDSFLTIVNSTPKKTMSFEYTFNNVSPSDPVVYLIIAYDVNVINFLSNSNITVTEFDCTNDIDFAIASGDAE